MMDKIEEKFNQVIRYSDKEKTSFLRFVLKDLIWFNIYLKLLS